LIRQLDDCVLQKWAAVLQVAKWMIL
jgi:hypothetical protein